MILMTIPYVRNCFSYKMKNRMLIDFSFFHAGWECVLFTNGVRQQNASNFALRQLNNFQSHLHIQWRMLTAGIRPKQTWFWCLTPDNIFDLLWTKPCWICIEYIYFIDISTLCWICIEYIYFIDISTLIVLEDIFNANLSTQRCFAE